MCVPSCGWCMECPKCRPEVYDSEGETLYEEDLPDVPDEYYEEYEEGL